jgi:cytochrome P450
MREAIWPLERVSTVCVGNKLARADLRLAIEAIINRFSDIRYSRGAQSCRFTTLYEGYVLAELWISPN